MSNSPRIRGRGPLHRGPYPLGQIPDELLVEIGKSFVYRMSVGSRNLTGDDWGDIFAGAVVGNHRKQPVGIADVERGNCAWSLKTVHQANPFDARRLRLISGRNNIAYSLGIDNRIEDPQATGEAVLSIWNARVNQAMGEYEDLRIMVLARNWATREFLLFEEEAQRFVPEDFDWVVNNNDNLEGHDRATGFHRFTWQRNGAQFTIVRSVPVSARRFTIGRRVDVLDKDAVLSHIGFTSDWVAILE